jgi:hypothetical protein
MRFKVGDKVRIVKKGLGVEEENGGAGMSGEVIFIDYVGSDIGYGVDSKEYKAPYSKRGSKNVWWFLAYNLELVDGEPLAQVSSEYNTVCPRCKAPAYIGLNNIECSRKCKKKN